MAEIIEMYYKKGLYADADLDVFVRAGLIAVEAAEKLREDVNVK